MADNQSKKSRRHRKPAQRCSRGPQQRHRLPGPKVRAAALAEFEGLIEEIGVEFDAYIRARRWEDLEALVGEYAQMLRLDATFLMHSAMLRGLVKHALTLTDPQQVAEFAGHIQAGIELANSGMPLAEAIAMFRASVEHREAFRAFDALNAPSRPAEVN